MKDTKIAMGIVLYNPSLSHIKKQIDELLPIVDYIYLIDNNSSNINSLKKIEDSRVKLIINKENYGISKALNQIVANSEKDNIDWVLTLDQDSFATKEMLFEMLDYIDLPDVSLISPRIIDINKEKNDKKMKKYEYIDRCITSGTLMKVLDVKEIGYFDEKMFIDYVDFDYCKRVCMNDKKIIRVNGAILNHEIGHRDQKTFLGIKVYPTNHSSLRDYYYIRNINYYLQKYHDELSIKENLREYIYINWKYLSVLLYEENKKEKVKMMHQAKKDYKKMF